MAGAPKPRGARSAILIALATTLLVAAPAHAQFSPGPAGAGDPFFPDAGNGGYDVSRYEISMRINPKHNRVRATTRVHATATQGLSSFDLDFRGPKVRSVRVGDAAAEFRREGQELIVTPPTGIPDGEPFVTKVRYRGRPRTLKDGDGSREGWFRTPDGSVAVGEPQGSPTWFPANDTPKDKASFRFRLSVPRGRKAIANGRLVERRRKGHRREYVWEMKQPMAPYLATVATGRFKLMRSKPSGIRSLVAVDPRLLADSRPGLRKTGRILKLFESLFGPYPFKDVGAIVDDAPFIGYALETQTRPVYDRPPGSGLIAHELAHQWYGNSVTLSTWPEIWLHEGFGTWAEWRWLQEDGGDTTARVLERLYDTPAGENTFWNPPPAALPGPAKLFSEPVYVRGGMALEVLRQRVGNADFLEILRRWAAEHAYGNATIDQFIALSESVAGDPGLSESVFQPWLFEPGKPPPPQARAHPADGGGQAPARR
jgi:aminopeptidase N